MAYTPHGHHIEGTPTDDKSRPVAKCGGPGVCKICSSSVAKYWYAHSNEGGSMTDTRNYPAPDLNEQLKVTLAQIQQQINVTMALAEERGVPVESMVDNVGQWLMTPLLSAKAQTLAALVQLNANVRF